MSTEDTALLDTRDMVALHRAFRRVLTDAPGQIASVREGDTERSRLLADYLADALWLLHEHHIGEDELLYPLLAERVPEEGELFARMEDQHHAVAEGIEIAQRAVERFGRSASAADGEAVTAACGSLLQSTNEHLVDEEEHVLPIAARVITPPEWGAMPSQGLSRYEGARLWLPFGIAYEGMPPDIQESMLARIPPPVAEMWKSGGSDAYAAEMAAVRGGGEPR